MRSLSIALTGFLLVNLVSARFEIINEWNGGWHGMMYIDIEEDIRGWDVLVEFDRSITQLEVFKAHITQNQGNRIYTLVNEPWDADLPGGSIFELDFIVRYPENTQPPALIYATINGRPIDIGIIPTGVTTPTTTAGTGPTTTTRPTSTTTRQPGQGYNYGDVLGLSLLFYEAQRTGPLPADNRVPWRQDSFVNDQGDGGLDLTGGYFDAGDHVKFGFPHAAFTTMIGWGLLDYRDGYAFSNELDNGLKALRWSLDYFIKCHPSPNEFYGQVGDGNEDHAFWGRPEEWPAGRPRPAYKITTSAPGSDLAGETAASFAVGYLVFKDQDPAYAATLLRHARELYDFANQYRGKYSDSITNAQAFYNSWSGFGDELGWSAAWLYRATNEEKYLTDARAHYTEFGLGARPQEFGWDDKKAGLQVLLAKVTGDTVYMNAAKEFCDFVLHDIPRSPKGLAFVSQWGALRHASNVAFICLQAADIGINVNEYRLFAKSQIGYMLGDTGRSFVVGYGQNPPQRPHHRSSSCPDRPQVCDWQAYNSPDPNPQTLTGALVGGPDVNDSYEDRRDDYIKNEVATDYNAGFQSTLAALNYLQYIGELP